MNLQKILQVIIGFVMLWSNRSGKEVTRKLASEFSLRENALYMPASDLLCVRAGFDNSLINNSTNLVFVERNKKVFKNILTNSEFKNVKVINSNLSKVKLPFNLDYAWLDLNGTITEDIYNWIKEELCNNLSNNAVICLTHELCWRNNNWMKKEKYQEVNLQKYKKFRSENSIYGSKGVCFPAFLMYDIFTSKLDCEVEVLQPYQYRDTIDMVFYRFEIRNFKGDSMKIVKASEVIEAIVLEKPNYKKLLNKYLLQQEKLGYQKTRTHAAIKACVTKKMNNMV